MNGFIRNFRMPYETIAPIFAFNVDHIFIFIEGLVCKAFATASLFQPRCVREKLCSTCSSPFPNKYPSELKLNDNNAQQHLVVFAWGQCVHRPLQFGNETENDRLLHTSWQHTNHFQQHINYYVPFLKRKSAVCERGLRVRCRCVCMCVCACG